MFAHICRYRYVCTCVCMHLCACYIQRYTFYLAFTGVTVYMSVYMVHTDLHAQCIHSGTNTYTHSALKVINGSRPELGAHHSLTLL